MTSSIDSLTGMPLPAMTNGATIATRPNAGAASGATGNAGFERLMGLQQRAREITKQIREATAKQAATSDDPAAEAVRKQRLHEAEQLDELRELVGPTPGSNTRHAFAAILERGKLSPGDMATIRLAQAADAGRIPPAAGAHLRSTIAALTSAMDSISGETKDPTLVQDPAKLAQFQERMGASQSAFDGLVKLLASGDAAAIASKLGSAAAQQNPGHVVRDVLAALKGR